MIDLSRYFYVDDTSPSGLRWKLPRSRGVVTGSVAGCINVKDLYWQVGLLGKRYKVHRVIAVLVGIISTYDSPLFIDHVNGIRGCNTVSNLRAVTMRQNGNNLVGHRNGRLVGTYRKGGKWGAQIQHGGNHVYLGAFPSEQAAHKAYMEYRERHALH